ncbi:MAG: TonB-dependent hemoglobin/transferrin/lactoferrin family receptor [Puniceicoccaceae bacterium 5H]|nr:MAG: TonB-dependent hemoglobin/transferrin/lactoferrin family receptor [Puniceicoccaceae bacterium 5H]
MNHRKAGSWLALSWAAWLAATPLHAQSDTDDAAEATEQTQEVDTSAERLRMPTLTVTATRTERPIMKTPASVVAVDMDDWNHEGGADAGDVVRYEPGVSMPFEFTGMDSFVPYRGGGYTNYRVRGVQGNRVLLTIDGIRLPPEFSMSGGNGRDYFDPAVFERVEILKGSGSTLHGSDAMGGVVSFETRSLQDDLIDSDKPWIYRNRLLVQEVDRSLNEVANFGWRSEPWYLTVVNSYRTGEEQKNDRGAVDANPVDTWSNHFLGKIGYSPSDVHQLTFTGEHFTRDTDTEVNSAEHTFTSPAVYHVHNEAEDTRTRFSLDYRQLPVDAWWQVLESKVYYQTSETSSFTLSQANPSGEETPTTRDRDDDIGFEHEIYGGDLQLTKEAFWWGLEHTWVGGVEASLENAENTFLRVDRKPVYQEERRPAFDPSDLIRADAYLQDVVEQGRWLFQGGVRVGFYAIEPSHDPTFLDYQGGMDGLELSPASDYDNLAISPSLAIQYELTPDTILWTRYARGIRNPSLEDYVGYFDHLGDFQQIPNPNLEEETSDSFDLGLKYDGEYVTLDTSVFYTFYDGFIVTRSFDMGEDWVMQQQNAGEVEIYGLDFSVDYRLAGLSDRMEGYTTGLKINLSEGENKSSGGGVDSVDPHTVIGYLAYDAPSGTWGARLTGTYRARKSDPSDNYLASGLYIPPSSYVLDLAAYWQINADVSLDFGLRNLTNRRYWTWPNADSVDHEFNENPELAVRPGINGYAALNVQF